MSDSPSRGARIRADTSQLARLIKTIEGEIVPRLLVSHRSNETELSLQAVGKLPDELDVRELVRLLLSHSTTVASAYVEGVRRRGASLEAICLELLAPAARELGLLWEEDECDFMQVTVGLCRLHQVLRELSPAFACKEIDHEVGRRILLSPFPGEQHTFGVTLVAHFLRRGGWDVWQVYPETSPDLLDEVRCNHFSLVGLSLGCEILLEGVSTLVAAVRAVSRNPTVGIMVGGPLLVANPGLAAAVGADGTAIDGRQAVTEAEKLRTAASLRGP